MSWIDELETINRIKCLLGINIRKEKESESAVKPIDEMSITDSVKKEIKPIKEDIYYSIKLIIRLIVVNNLESFIYLESIKNKYIDSSEKINDFRKWFHNREQSKFYTFRVKNKENVMNREHVIDYSIEKEQSNTKPVIGEQINEI